MILSIKDRRTLAEARRMIAASKKSKFPEHGLVARLTVCLETALRVIDTLEKEVANQKPELETE